MISKHIAFLCVVSIFMMITFLFLRRYTNTGIDIFYLGVFLAMSFFSGVIGGLFAYDD